ncbi:coiled-coil domain-containing protein [Longispora urticae]
MLVAITPAQAEPEGGTKPLRDALRAASQGYQDARTAIANAKKREGELSEEILASQAKVADLSAAVGRLAAAQYRGGSSAQLQALLSSGSPESFLDTAATVRYLSERDGAQVTALKAAQATLARQRKDLDAAILEQENQLKELRKRQDEALKALRSAGGGDPTLGFGDLPANATPAPRNPDGSFPSEGCSVKDPTTSGCLSPRTLHAYNETKKANFDHYVSCYRSAEDGGEHPRGKACDWSSAAKGFGGMAVGAEKDYGNKLAAWYIANADRLGVLYVIWFRQIWMPGTGWRSYFGSGDPSSEHTNHVHLSMR